MTRPSLFRRLFGCARPAPKPVRRSRLAMESLELRDVPAVFVVNTLVDENDGLDVGGVSLRDAINAANASPDGDEIRFGVTGTINVHDWSGTGFYGELPDIQGELLIRGPGANQLAIGTETHSPSVRRVFNVAGGASLTLKDLTVSNANGRGVGPDGNGVYNNGTLVVLNCVFAYNSASDFDAYHGEYIRYNGGGIYNAGTLYMEGSTVHGNLAAGEGGGIYNAGTMKLSNCTISDNGGGNVYNAGTAEVTNCTIAGYNLVYGIRSTGTLVLNNSIVAVNGSWDVALQGTVSGSHNLISDGTDAGTGLTDTITGNPLLGPLADNGGPTPTHALSPASPARDAGDDALALDTTGNPLTTDQRGFPRVGGRADVGAFEFANRAPTDVSLSNASVAENRPAGTVVGTFDGADPDPFESFTYSFYTEGAFAPDNSLFEIVGNELRTKASFDFETKNSFWIWVRGTDAGGRFAEKIFTIGVTDADDTPTGIALGNTTVAENQPAGTAVGTFATTDPDAGDTFTYALVYDLFSPGVPSFYVDAGGTLRTLAPLDFEARSSYSVRVRSTDAGGLFAEKVFAVGVADVNEQPTDITLSSTTVGENLRGGTEVGTFGGTDPDFGDTLTYALVAGPGSADNSSFTISRNHLLTNGPFDFEQAATRSVRVRATDAAGLSREEVFAIAVADRNDAPTAIALSTSSLVENRPAGTVVGTLSTADQDAGDPHTYTAFFGDTDALEIVGNELRTKAAFDFEARNSYSVRVRSTDAGGLSTESLFTIAVTDVNEAPTGIALSNATVAENQPAGAVVGTLATADPDGNVPHTYTLVGGGDWFTVNADGTVTTAASFDFEGRNSYWAWVRSTDAGGLSVDQVLTVGVTNANDAPVGVSLSNAAVAENLPAGTVVGAFTTTDPDAGDTFSYAVVGGDAGAFTVDAAGNLRTAAGFDYEARSGYSVRVRSTDAGGLSAERTFAVGVLNVNEAPTLAVPGSQVAFEDADLAVAGITVGDPDGDALTVKVVAGHGMLTLGTTAGLTIAGNGSGVLTLSGSVASLNAALATLTYRGALNFGGDEWLNVTVGDGGLSTSGSVAVHVRSAVEQAAALQAQVAALQAAGGLTKSQANALKLDVKGNSNDVSKVQAFLTQVQAYLNAGVLTAAQADALAGPGRVLLLSVSRR